MNASESFLLSERMATAIEELATVLGHDVDQPRNLAKSVTVE